MDLKLVSELRRLRYELQQKLIALDTTIALATQGVLKEHPNDENYSEQPNVGLANQIRKLLEENKEGLRLKEIKERLEKLGFGAAKMKTPFRARVATAIYGLKKREVITKHGRNYALVSLEVRG